MPLSAPPTERRLGLHRLVPAEGTTDTTTLDVVAIHGLDNESPRTWIFEKIGTQVHWLRDSDMLPAAIPEARIYTYDWNAKVFDHAPVQTLLGHADNLLGQVAAKRGQGSEARPLISVASCFGGLVLAEAICRAAQEGSPYRWVLLATVGAVFLATPFAGTDAAQPASWLVTIKGIMEFFRGVFHDGRKDPKALIILVAESSACIHGHYRQGLEKQHVIMNKFEGHDNSQFKLVRYQIQQLASGAKEALRCRRNESILSHFLVRFDRNEDFVGRETVLGQLLDRIPPRADLNACQRTVIEGLGGIGKTQVAIEAAYRVREAHPDCSVFWVPAVDMTMFENAYREVGQELGVKGIEDDKADVKILVKAALGREEAGQWLLIIDNIDDTTLFTDGQLLSYLPFSRQGSILFTTRNHQAASRFDTRHVIRLEELDKSEARELLYQRLEERQRGKLEDTAKLLDYLTCLPLAVRQASAYMALNPHVTISEYVGFCRSSNEEMVELLSENFDDQTRYEHIRNQVALKWLISFKQISRGKPLAAEYLQSISYLAEKDIPTTLFPLGDKKRAASEAISTLEAYAFLQRKAPDIPPEDATEDVLDGVADKLDIHRLIRLVVRNWVREQGNEREQVTKTVATLARRLPWPTHANQKLWSTYLPHSQAILEFKDQCTENKNLLPLQHSVAEGYYLLGKYSEAEQMHRRTLGLRETVLGREHPDTLASMNNLGAVIRDMEMRGQADKTN